jgi:hypothetical protein
MTAVRVRATRHDFAMLIAWADTPAANAAIQHQKAPASCLVFLFEVLSQIASRVE